MRELWLQQSVLQLQQAWLEGKWQAGLLHSRAPVLHHVRFNSGAASRWGYVHLSQYLAWRQHPVTPLPLLLDGLVAWASCWRLVPAQLARKVSSYSCLHSCTISLLGMKSRVMLLSSSCLHLALGAGRS
jgi:hypothetical protein